jgi:glycosyltransferase involved in cell wall biosynthesis
MGDKIEIKQPFVVYWNNQPAPYMVERFNALVDIGTLDFEAWFNDRLQSDRSWAVDEANWRFRYRYLPTTRLFGRRLHWPLPLLGRRPDVLVSLYAEPSFIVGWAIAKSRGAKTGFRVLKTSDRWISRNFVKNAIKRFLFGHVDAIETPGAEGKEFAVRCGASEERIFFATHTVDIQHFQAGAAAAQPQRDKLREQLGLTGTTFIYVGRLWWVKGVKYLLDAFERVQQQKTEEVSLLLLGDGEEEGRLKQACIERGIRNVVFAGFRQKPDLPRYYALADVFVFPTLGDAYGLVVNEAMACSLPVVSTSSAGEIRDRVDEGVNGYIVPPEDSVTLADRMLLFVNNPELCKEMGRISAQKIVGHTPERWAEDFERAIRQILLRPRRTGI